MDRINITDKELDLCRTKIKALKAPYISKGDTGQPYSPGEWDRILSYSNSLVNNTINSRTNVSYLNEEIWKKPSYYRSGVDGQGAFDGTITKVLNYIPSWTCTSTGDDSDPKTQGTRLLNAAFAWLITNDSKYLNVVKKVMALQFQEPVTDFGNVNIWKPFVIKDLNPSFIAAEWINRYFVSYIYTYESYTATEKALYEKRFKDAANYFVNDVNYVLNSLFTNRWSDNYALLKATSISDSIYYDGSEKIAALEKYYNNRRADQMKAAAYIGVFFKDQDIIDSVIKFWKEWLRFAVNPRGLLGEMERAYTDKKEQGFAYSLTELNVMAEIADILNRAGYEDLTKYTTRLGYGGTECKIDDPDKSLQLVINQYLSMMSGAINLTFLGEVLDGDEAARDWHCVHEVPLAATMDLYYNSIQLKAAYTRTGNNRPYPSFPDGSGANHPYMGPGGTRPSPLLMYGGNGGRINEFLNRIQETTIPNNNNNMEPLIYNLPASGGTSRIEAELFFNKVTDLDGDIIKQSNPGHSGDADISLFDIGDKVKFIVNMDVDGDYSFKARVRTGYNSTAGSNKTVYAYGYNIAVNDVIVPFVLDEASIGVAETKYGGSFFGNICIDRLELNAGQNTITIEATGTYRALDYIEVSKLAPIIYTLRELKAKLAGAQMCKNADDFIQCAMNKGAEGKYTLDQIKTAAAVTDATTVDAVVDTVFTKGKVIGTSEGTASGLIQGKADGIVEGKSIGLVEGQVIGKTDTIKKVSNFLTSL